MTTAAAGRRKSSGWIEDVARDYWLPVPQNEIDKVAGRNSEFKQNTGW